MHLRKEIPRLEIISGVEDALRRTKVMEEELEKVRASIASFVRKAKCPKSKITADEREALASLRNNDDIVILEADKGNATVVLDREVYEHKVKDILGQKP